MRRSSKLVLTAVLLIAVGFCGAEGYKQWKRYKTQELYTEILPYTGVAKAQGFDAQMDSLRIFVNTHSVHEIDAEFKSYWRAPDEIARRMLAIAKGDTDKKLHMECSTRSGMMGAFTKALGYRTRSVMVYGLKDNILLSHTFLEVQDPETQKWQVQHPDLDLVYTVKGRKDRASIEDLIKAEIKDITPCNASGACGWDIKNREGTPAKKVQKYLGLASINDYQVKNRPLLVNTKRFDLDKPVHHQDKDAPYCTHLKKNCRDEVVKF
jgi:hypothetical protein